MRRARLALHAVAARSLHIPELIEAAIKTAETIGVRYVANVQFKRAADGVFKFQAGAFPGSPVVNGIMCGFALYDIANVRVVGFDVVSNRSKVAAYRAPGAPASEYAVEATINELAEMLNIEPMDLRLKNASREGTLNSVGAPWPTIGAEAVMQAVKNHPHYNSELQGEDTGRGVALGFWFNGGMESSGTASVQADGRVSLILGTVDIGGSRASMAMQLAEVLGLTVDDIKPQVVDSDSVGYNATTGGSRVTFQTGWVVYDLTGSGGVLGAINLMRSVPILLFSPAAGAATDRMRQNRIIAVSQFCMFVLTFLIAFDIRFGFIQVWHLFVFVFLMATAQTNVNDAGQTRRASPPQGAGKRRGSSPCEYIGSCRTRSCAIGSGRTRINPTARRLRLALMH